MCKQHELSSFQDIHVSFQLHFHFVIPCYFRHHHQCFIDVKYKNHRRYRIDYSWLKGLKDLQNSWQNSVEMLTRETVVDQMECYLTIVFIVCKIKGTLAV